MKTTKELMEFAQRYDNQTVLHKSYNLAADEIVKLLRSDEDVVFVFRGLAAKRKDNPFMGNVYVALTNQRLIIGGYIQLLFKATYTTQTYKIENINSISPSRELMSDELVIDTIGEDVRISIPRREAVNQIINDFENALHEIKKRENTPTNIVSAISSADELKKFKELLDCGVITQEEFDAKKKQLLGL